MKSAFILDDIYGSDHCPVGIEIEIEDETEDEIEDETGIEIAVQN